MGKIDIHIEAFNIGFFSCRSLAEKVAAKYLSEVNGFKDYNVAYRITEKYVVGSADDIKLSDVFIIYGWNENDRLDEIDVYESDCYSSLQEAKARANEMTSQFDLKEWALDKYKIDECHWQEGFERVYY